LNSERFLFFFDPNAWENQSDTNGRVREMTVGWGIIGCGDVVRKRVAQAIIDDPDSKLDVKGALTLRERTSDPSDPDEGSCVIWMSDGTGAGDDGDIMIKITAASVTSTHTLVDKNP